MATHFLFSLFRSVWKNCSIVLVGIGSSITEWYLISFTVFVKHSIYKNSFHWSSYSYYSKQYFSELCFWYLNWDFLIWNYIFHYTLHYLFHYPSLESSFNRDNNWYYSLIGFYTYCLHSRQSHSPPPYQYKYYYSLDLSLNSSHSLYSYYNPPQ